MSYIHAVNNPEFGCKGYILRIGWVEIQKIKIKYILRILLNPSGGIYPIYAPWIRTCMYHIFLRMIFLNLFLIFNFYEDFFKY